MTIHGGWLDEIDVRVAGQVPLPGMPDEAPERDDDPSSESP